MISTYLQAPITLLLGEQDTDPSKPSLKIWNCAPEAEEQGPHRLARGHSFFEEGKVQAERMGVLFEW